MRQNADFPPVTIRWADTAMMAKAWFFGMIALAGIAMALQNADQLPGALPALVPWAAPVAGLALIFFVWRVLTSRAVFSADKIESYGPLGKRELSRTQIAGYRQDNRGRRTKLIPSGDGLKPVAFATRLLKRPAIADWLDGFADLDARDADAWTREFEQDARYGATVAERNARLARMQQIGNAVQFLVLVPALGAIYVHLVSTLAIADVVALFPVLAFALSRWSNGLLPILPGADGDQRIPLLSTLILSSLMLAGLAISTIHLLDWLRLAEWTAIVAAAAMAVLASRSAFVRADWNATLFVTLGVIAYVCGVLAIADVQLDTSRPDVFRTQVLDARTQESRGGTSYVLTLAPWGPVAESSDIHIPFALYHGLSRGDTVCMSLHRGRLGLPWYDVDVC
jgi:hypothetical protein